MPRESGDPETAGPLEREMMERQSKGGLPAALEFIAVTLDAHDRELKTLSEDLSRLYRDGGD